MSADATELSATRDVALRVAQSLLSRGSKADAIEILTVWAAAKNDADGHKLLAEALRHGPDNPLAKAAFAKMEGIGDGAPLAAASSKWTVEALKRLDEASKKPTGGWQAEVGYNNNVKYRNAVFHIQTEDSGVKKPHIITHLFADGGRIFKSIKRSYASLVGTPNLSEQVRALMKGQHKEMYIALREGRYDDIIDGKAPGGMETLEGPPNTEPRKSKASGSTKDVRGSQPSVPALIAPAAPVAEARPATASQPAPPVVKAPVAAPVLVRARLHVIRAQGDGPLVYEITKDECFLGKDADLKIFGDPFVSGKHASLRYKEGRLEIDDAGSVNGTFLRVRRPVELDFGDIFVAGDEMFRVEATKPPNDGPDSSPTYFYSSPKWHSTFRLEQVWEGGTAGACVVARTNSLQIGRTASDLNFPHDYWMSDAHCVVEDQGGFMMLTDLGSRGGTFTKVKAPVRLITGDELLLGRTRLRVEVVQRA